MQLLPLLERAESYDNRLALRSSDGEFSYAQVLELALAVAAELLDERDDLQESRVAFLMPASVEYVATQWGTWQAGGIAVPLSLSATEAELEYTLTDAQVETVVTVPSHAAIVSKLVAKLEIRQVVLNGPLVGELPTLPQVDESRRAMILYTSGTTSKPKGVVTTHECIRAQIDSLITAWHWQSDDRIPLFLPLHHIHGIINVMSCALWAGAEIEAYPRFEIDKILRRITEDAYTVFMAVPTIYVKLIEAIELATPAEYEQITAAFGRLRLMISGSAALPASIHEKWAQLTGQVLLERYGMTEIGMALSNSYLGERRPGAVGLPLPGVEIRLRSEDGNLIDEEEEVAGEIEVRGPNVFLEYFNRDEATRASFREGWFKTGDVAVLERGYFRIMGRTSVDIIKSGGYKLSALEIEASLLDHAAIRECAVVGIADDTWGEIVAAAVVIGEGLTLDLDQLQSWCKDRISHYKIPRKLLLVDELPRNAMGKVTKPAVSQLFV